MVSIPKHLRHGESGSRLHHIWCDMRKRCHNPNTEWYYRYGGRGIRICDQWENFVPFRDWAITSGYANNLTIDRIDINGNYCPENCRWATRKEQARNQANNRIIEANGEKKCLAAWAEDLGIHHDVLRGRIKRGWGDQEAITIPPIEIRSNSRNSSGQFVGLRESHLV